MSRQTSLTIYIALWSGLYLYAVVAGIHAGLDTLVLMDGVERFLPLQAVASLAAVGVFFAGRRLRRGSRYRRASVLPAVSTTVGALAVVALLMVQGLSSGYVTEPASQTLNGLAAADVITISL